MLLSLPFRPRLERLDDRLTPALTFAAQQPFAVGATPQAVTVADFNGDGRPDIATANGTDNTVTVLTNNTPVGAVGPSFAVSSYATGTFARALAAGDFNGDGRSDLAVANAGDGTVSVLLNTSPPTSPGGAGLPTFAAGVSFAVGANPSVLAVADFNGDGRPDIVVSADRISVLTNAMPAGAATPAFATNQIVVSFANRGSMAVGDFNSDGRPDIAYTESQYVRFIAQYNNFVRVVTNTTQAGAGTVTLAGVSPVYMESFTNSPRAYLLGTGDVNGDGQTDITIDSGTAVVQNTSTPVADLPMFGGPQSFAFASGVSGVGVVADLDGDGRSDMAAFGNGAFDTASALTNTTPVFSTNLTFHAEGGVFVGLDPVAMAAGDFNADGRIDLVTANAGDNTVSVLANTTAVSVTVAPVVGQFGDGGVRRLNRSTGGWDPLTSANADVLAVAPNGSAVGHFDDNGVWYYNPAHGWYLINSHRATALAMDGLGNVYASFPGFGTAVYRLQGGWSGTLTGVAADHLAVNAAGELVASFAGYGVYRHTPAAGWRLLTENRSATALAVADNGDVAVNFAGFGVYRHRPAVGWDQLNAVEATSLAVGADGQVVAHFAGYGVARYHRSANWWQPLSAPAGATAVGSVAMDLYGNVFAAFGGVGVWEYNPFAGWRLRTGGVPGLLAAGA